MDEITSKLSKVQINEEARADKRCVDSFCKLDDEIDIGSFVLSSYFTSVCDVMLDKEMNVKTGKKKRKTDIVFRPNIEVELWESHTEWIYVITCDSKIMKIGGTRTGLKARTQSYLCGRPEYRKNGTCSTTNYTLYTSILNLLREGCKVEMFARQLRSYTVTINDFGFEDIEMPVQIYHAFESKVLEAYKKQTGHYPILSNNCDKRFT